MKILSNIKNKHMFHFIFSLIIGFYFSNKNTQKISKFHFRELIPFRRYLRILVQSSQLTSLPLRNNMRILDKILVRSEVEGTQGGEKADLATGELDVLLPIF